MKNIPEAAAVKDPVHHLLSILGDNVLLLHWPLGAKAAKKPWKHLTVEAMNDPDYVAQLGTGNIGIVQGSKSAGLCSIDIDTEEAVGEFLRLNPSLRESLRSKGQRGCNIWFRAKGRIPPTRKITFCSGKAWGELRGEGAQTIIHGKHPAGCDYRLIVEKPPVSVEVSSIFWPDDVRPPAIGEDTDLLLEVPSLTKKSTPTSQEAFRPNRAEKQTSDEELCWEPYESLDQAVQGALPSDPHTNHEALFKLARAVKAMEQAQVGRFKRQQRKLVFRRWYELSSDFLRKEQTMEDYLIEFLNSCEAAKYPQGTADLEAWRKASSWDLWLSPDLLAEFGSPDLRRTIAFCIVLQHRAGTGPFFISCRTLQRLLRHKSHTVSARWLRALTAYGFLEEVAKGSVRLGKATRYRIADWPAAREAVEASSLDPAG